MKYLFKHDGEPTKLTIDEIAKKSKCVREYPYWPARPKDSIISGMEISSGHRELSCNGELAEDLGG